jgi:hypothetical protein
MGHRPYFFQFILFLQVSLSVEAVIDVAKRGSSGPQDRPELVPVDVLSCPKLGFSVRDTGVPIMVPTVKQGDSGS